MPEVIIDGNGSNFYMTVNPDGSINTVISGTINIGSVSAQVDSIYVQSGNISITEEPPTSVNKNNSLTNLVYISSGTSTGITMGSCIGSIIKFIGTGSYVQILTYTNDNLTNIGSWS